MERRSFLFGGSALFALRAEGQPVPSSPSPIACHAFTSGTTLKRGGEFQLTGYIFGVAEFCRVFSPLGWGWRGFVVSVLDASHQKFSPPINNFHVPSLQAFNRPEDYVPLYKGMIVGESAKFRVDDFFRNGGAFTIAVGYLSPVPKAVTSLDDVISSEDGVFMAPPIAVEVS